MNFPLIVSLLAIIITQLVKYPIAKFFNKSRANINIVTSTGGMPSSHSAATSSLITALILQYGFKSPYVAIAIVFGVIVMFDSMAVRRQSGEQGLIIDALANEKIKEDQQIGEYDLDDYKELMIKNYLGHKPSEVIGGVIGGILLAILIYRFFPFAE